MTPTHPQAPNLDPDRAGPIEIARALVSIPSVNPELSPGGAGEGPIAEVVAGWLRGWGFAVETREAAPGRVSLLARAGSGRPRTLLNGHLDTVGTEGMSIDPFDPRVSDGRLHGRGSCDMKAGLAAILAAVRNHVRSGIARGEIVVALTADEEHASIGLRDLLDRGLASERAIVAEPTSLALHVANKGFCWVDAEVRGRAAHGSRPDLGRDAIRHAGWVLAALDAFEEEAQGQGPHPLLGRPSIHAGTIQGGTTPSVYPARCDLVLEARTLPGEGPPEVMARLERALERTERGRGTTGDPPRHGREERLDISLRPGLHRPGAEIAPDSPLVVELARACRAEGVEPRIEGMSAWVESAWLVEAGIPALCFGPGSIELAHTADESVPVAEIELAARVFERFLAQDSPLDHSSSSDPT